VSTKSFGSLTALVRELVETATTALQNHGGSLEQVARRQLRDEALAEVGLTAEDVTRASELKTEMEKAGVTAVDLRFLRDVEAQATAAGYPLESAHEHASRVRELVARGVGEDELRDLGRAEKSSSPPTVESSKSVEERLGMTRAEAIEAVSSTDALDRAGLTPAHLDRTKDILRLIEGTTLDAGDVRYIEFVEKALQQLEKPGSHDWETGNLVRAVIADLDLVATRLLGNEPELFSAVDRLRSEAEFRRAIVVPMAALAILLWLGWHEVWLLGLIPALVLLYDGSRRDRAGRDLLVDALRLERVQAPAIEKFQRAVRDVVGPEGDPWARPQGATQSEGVNGAGYFRSRNLT
jgi:hypothetical protein